MNALESIKIIDEVTSPYVNAQYQILSNPSQAALLIFHVFRGQITDEGTSHSLQNNIYFVTVPNNMTHLFQALDLTVDLFQTLDLWALQKIHEKRVCKMAYATG